MKLLNIHRISSIINDNEVQSILFNNKINFKFDAPLFNVGIHPWDCEKGILSDLEEVIKLYSSQIFAIGEIGLDKIKGPGIEKQKEVFENQIELAQRYQINNLLIHSVKSYYDFIPYIKEESLNFIFHDFNGVPDQISQLRKYPNTYFSLGNNFLKDNSQIYQNLHLIPRNRLFFETSDKDFSILEVYQRYCFALELELTDIIQCINTNFSQIAKQGAFL